MLVTYLAGRPDANIHVVAPFSERRRIRLYEQRPQRTSLIIIDWRERVFMGGAAGSQLRDTPFQPQRAAHPSGTHKRPRGGRDCRAVGNGSEHGWPTHPICDSQSGSEQSIRTRRLPVPVASRAPERRQVRTRPARSSQMRLPLLPKHGRPGHDRPGRCSFSSASGRFGQESHHRRF